MTEPKKTIVIGKGRLYFGDRLLGEVGPAKDDEISLMRERKPTFTATFRIDTPAYDRAFRNIWVQGIVGYNPQRLLPDLRGSVKRWADENGVLAHYVTDIWNARTPPFPESLMDFAKGGTLGETFVGSPTGRFRSDRYPEYQKIPVISPFDEIVVSKASALGNLSVPADYSKVEARVVQSFKIDVSAIDLASAAVQKVVDQMTKFRAAAYDVAVRNALFGAYIRPPEGKPEPMTRSRRVQKLVRSSDPRQQKRGARLMRDDFRASFPHVPYAWAVKSRPAPFFIADEIDMFTPEPMDAATVEELMAPRERSPWVNHGEEVGRFSGRGYDPTRYRKD